MILHREACSSQQLPRPRLRPLRGFLSCPGVLLGPSTCLVRCFRNLLQTVYDTYQVWRASRRGPRAPSTSIKKARGKLEVVHNVFNTTTWFVFDESARSVRILGLLSLLFSSAYFYVKSHSTTTYHKI